MRIYRLHHTTSAASVTDLSSLDTQVRRSAELGFSHVLLAAPLCETWYRSEHDNTLRQLTTLCAQHHQVLLLDLRVDRSVPDDTLIETHADQHANKLPQSSTEQALAWIDRLRTMVAIGVGGFRCMLPASVPASSWARIIAAVRESGAPVIFAAWTPGLTMAQLRTLSPCGFDSVFSSLPWWDFRSVWLIDEHQSLRSLQAKIINPVVAEIAGIDPADNTLAADPFPLNPALAHRLILAAIATGDGWLMPAGFITEGLAEHHTHRAAGIDEQVTCANRWLATLSSVEVQSEAASATIATHSAAPSALHTLSGPDSPLTLLARITPAAHGGETSAPLVIAINPDANYPSEMRVDRILTGMALPDGAGALVADAAELQANATSSDAPCNSYGPLDDLLLGPAQVRLFRAGSGPIQSAIKATRGKAVERRALEAALQTPRISIEQIQPQCDNGRFAVRRIVGERVTVSADVWMDGHDMLSVALCWRVAGTRDWQEIRMAPLGNDRWQAAFPLERLGRHEFTVQAWRDPFATWLDEIEKKRAVGLDLTLEIEEGSRLLQAIAEYAAHAASQSVVANQVEPEEPWRRALIAQSHALKAHAKIKTLDPAVDANHDRLQILLDPLTRLAVDASAYRPFLNQSAPVYPLEADRVGARYASWYELFPRSQTDNAARHGTFDDVIERLPAISAMGFDVLYFPPIHPIGMTHRKGRNNSLNAQPFEPGSPYAIGSLLGGHEAIHPELGTLADFRRLRDAAAAQGLELALDFAIQCAPDHPWLREHPEWFAYRPDGTVRYAENPPKRYQDIVNVDFYGEATPGSLWQALRNVVLFWADQGIRIFRVDNPHTKPLPFWEWLIAEVRHRYPGTLFLAEAFTRPKPMARLAKLGFTQSYTYFTWRNDKAELSEYMTQLTQSELREYFRPHFFVNTPDINPYFLHRSGRPGFLIRAALAALLSGLWGMVSGFELCESEPLVVKGEIKEEYLDSEKFQIRPRDITGYSQQPNNIVAEITRLNAIRRSYPALQNHLGVRFYRADNPHMLFFARYQEADPLVAEAPRFGQGVVLVAINLDPFNVQEADIEVPVWEWQLSDDATLQVEELMTGHQFTWTGRRQHIRLDPQHNPFAVWHVRAPAAESIRRLL